MGGGSLIYSNVSIRSVKEARDRIGLNISDADYDAARQWMEGPHNDRKNANRGWLNYVVTKIPIGKDMTAADFVDPESIPQSHLWNRTRMKRISYWIVAASYEWLRNRFLRSSVFPWSGTHLSCPCSSMTVTRTLQRSKTAIRFSRIPTANVRAVASWAASQARHTLNKTLFKKVLQKPGVYLDAEVQGAADQAEAGRIRCDF